MAKIIGRDAMTEPNVKIYVPASKQLKITVIGGGHGQSAALRGLKKITRELTGIVAVSDDGGGSGMLRESLGILPPGDIRNCIMALSDTEPLFEQLMDYRFQGGNLTNQSFGNLFLAAMYGISDSFEEAVNRMCSVLSTTGRVIPVTDANVFLEAEFENGKVTRGESTIYYDKKLNDCRISQVRLDPPHPQALPAAVDAIMNADVLIYGPGSLYTSVIPNFLVDGIAEAAAKTKALRIFAMNIMTQDGETEGYTAADHLRAFLDHSGENIVDICLCNNEPIPENVLSEYRKENSEPIRIDREAVEALGIRLETAPLVSAATRFARHDSDKLAEEILRLYEVCKLEQK